MKEPYKHFSKVEVVARGLKVTYDRDGNAYLSGQLGGAYYTGSMGADNDKVQNRVLLDTVSARIFLEPDKAEAARELLQRFDEQGFDLSKEKTRMRSVGLMGVLKSAYRRLRHGRSAMLRFSHETVAAVADNKPTEVSQNSAELTGGRGSCLLEPSSPTTARLGELLGPLFKQAYGWSIAEAYSRHIRKPIAPSLLTTNPGLEKR